ncbi:MAG: inositol monophosphatase [Propionibacteriaceae bacterium]|nr:inositol monophosphatase [Propionibacteriaceae bacterium]
MYEEHLRFATALAAEAGEIMHQHFDANPASVYKADKSIVTVADTEINDLVIARVRTAFPDHAIDGEEASFGAGDQVWVCDPIDGTSMFAMSVPTSTFSIAYCEQGEPKVAVVLDPWLDKLYTAVKGAGAFCNQEPLRVSALGLDDLGAMGNFDYWPTAAYDILAPVADIMHRTYTVSLGSCVRTLLMVASGRLAFSIFPGGEGKNMDVATGKLMIEEAGGRTSDLWGADQRYDRPIRGFVGSNGVVHDQILEYLRQLA